MLTILLTCQTLFAQEWLEITIATESVPRPRTNATAIYDTQSHRMILFGGRTQGREDLNDIWAFELASRTWTELIPVQGSEPAPRRTPNSVYDSDNHVMVIWSGQTGSATLNDVWTYRFDTNVWTEWQPPDPKPKMRYGAASLFDPMAKELVTFAGFTSSGRFNDSWRLNLQGNMWTEVTPSENLPLVRCLHSASYNSLDHQMIIYGGQTSGGVLGDIWAFDLNQNRWTDLTPQDRPPGRWFAANIYDPGRHAAIIFGGNLGTGKSNETWIFDLENRSWVPFITSETVPSPRDGASAIYVAEESQMILFGGQDAKGTYLQDIWLLDPSLPVSVESSGAPEWPQQFRLLDNYPNPFNPSTAIVFELSRPGRVEVKIYDVRGQLVTTLGAWELSPGRHELIWNGKNANGEFVSTGLYFYKLQSGRVSASGKMLLTK
ncbi:T9SS type A sorting domain-containing protein [bacterium]|nr:T9SS type A sorting domain-containing protein [bacterium]